MFVCPVGILLVYTILWHILNIGRLKFNPERCVANVSSSIDVYIPTTTTQKIYIENPDSTFRLKMSPSFSSQNYRIHHALIAAIVICKNPIVILQMPCVQCLLALGRPDVVDTGPVSVDYGMFMRHLHLNVPVITSWGSNEVFTAIDPGQGDIDCLCNPVCTCFSTMYLEVKLFDRWWDGKVLRVNVEAHMGPTWPIWAPRSP